MPASHTSNSPYTSWPPFMFESLDRLPPDPILGISVAYAQDTHPDKIDVGVGVYRDEQGKTPIMKAVKRAEAQLAESETSKAYAPACGESQFVQRYNSLAFGANHSILTSGRLASAQTPGGCGALRVAAELSLRAASDVTIWLPTPTWGNHQPLLGNAGVQLKFYRYYDTASHELQYTQMMDDLAGVQRGDLVLFHGCCHNPTGADLSESQWQDLAGLAHTIGFIPFIDMAYQGMGSDIDQDAYGLRHFAEQLPEVILVGSCSKNFGLYRERAGAISIIAENVETATTTQSQLANVIRGIYSTPPTHGASIVSIILDDAKLESLWQQELGIVRARMQAMRALLTRAIEAQNIDRDFSFINRQQGMFSLLGITPQQVVRLRETFSVYMIEDSRISIAGINEQNVERLAAAIAAVL